jgi:hypothetical protein
VKGLEPL